MEYHRYDLHRAEGVVQDATMDFTEARLSSTLGGKGPSGSWHRPKSRLYKGEPEPARSPPFGCARFCRRYIPGIPCWGTATYFIRLYLVSPDIWTGTTLTHFDLARLAGVRNRQASRRRFIVSNRDPAGDPPLADFGHWVRASNLLRTSDFELRVLRSCFSRAGGLCCGERGRSPYEEMP